MKASASQLAFMGAFLALCGLGNALATQAYTTSSTYLRAGPDTTFPQIQRVPYASTVEVYGCTTGYGWCDVDYGGERGWFPGNRLQFNDHGRRGSITNLAPLLGLMIMQFSVQDYWGNHYQDRAWYTDQNRQRFQNWQPNNRHGRFQAPFMQQNNPFRPIVPVPDNGTGQRK